MTRGVCSKEVLKARPADTIREVWALETKLTKRL